MFSRPWKWTCACITFELVGWVTMLLLCCTVVEDTQFVRLSVRGVPVPSYWMLAPTIQWVWILGQTLSAALFMFTQFLWWVGRRDEFMTIRRERGCSRYLLKSKYSNSSGRCTPSLVLSEPGSEKSSSGSISPRSRVRRAHSVVFELGLGDDSSESESLNSIPDGPTLEETLDLQQKYDTEAGDAPKETTAEPITAGAEKQHTNGLSIETHNGDYNSGVTPYSNTAAGSTPGSAHGCHLDLDGHLGSSPSTDVAAETSGFRWSKDGVQREDHDHEDKDAMHFHDRPSSSSVEFVPGDRRQNGFPRGRKLIDLLVKLIRANRGALIPWRDEYGALIDTNRVARRSSSEGGIPRASNWNDATYACSIIVGGCMFVRTVMNHPQSNPSERSMGYLNHTLFYLSWVCSWGFGVAWSVLAHVTVRGLRHSRGRRNKHVTRWRGITNMVLLGVSLALGVTLLLHPWHGDTTLDHERNERVLLVQMGFEYTWVVVWWVVRLLVALPYLETTAYVGAHFGRLARRRQMSRQV